VVLQPLPGFGCGELVLVEAVGLSGHRAVAFLAQDEGHTGRDRLAGEGLELPRIGDASGVFSRIRN
jgi:hypothetical protein